MLAAEIYTNELIEALKWKRAAVMVGAGFSKNADKLMARAASSKDWNELADVFWKLLYNDRPESEKKYVNVMRLAEEMEHTFGRNKLNQVIKEALADEAYVPSDIHREFVELPWSDIFTTNYDTLLERAAANIIGDKYKTIYTKQDLVGSGGKRRIVKLQPFARPSNQFG